MTGILGRSLCKEKGGLYSNKCYKRILREREIGSLLQATSLRARLQTTWTVRQTVVVGRVSFGGLSDSLSEDRRNVIFIHLKVVAFTFSASLSLSLSPSLLQLLRLHAAMVVKWDRKWWDRKMARCISEFRLYSLTRPTKQRRQLRHHQSNIDSHEEWITSVLLEPTDPTRPFIAYF